MIPGDVMVLSGVAIVTGRVAIRTTCVTIYLGKIFKKHYI